MIAVPLGVLAATKQYSRADYVITSVALVGISLPTFFFATLLKLFFSVKLGWFDLYGLVGRDYAQLDSMGQFLDKANHLVLPIVTLVIVSIGGYMRYTRTNMLEVLNADYIRTARAKAAPSSPRHCSPSRASATSLTSPWSRATSRSRCSTCPSWRC